MNRLPTVARVVFVWVAAIPGPGLAAWGADGADPAVPPAPSAEKQAAIRKAVDALAGEDAALHEEARRTLLTLGVDAAEELAKAIERADAARGRLGEALKLIRDLELTPEQQKMLATFRSIRVTLEFNEQPLREVVEFLCQFTNLNFVVDFKGGLQEPAAVTLKVQNIPLENALNLILEPFGFVWYLDGTTIVLAPGKDVEPRRRLWIQRHMDGKPDPKDPDVIALQNRLDTLKVSLDFKDTGLEDAVEFIRQFSGLSMVIAPAVRGDKAAMEKTFSYKTKDTLLSNCLRMLLSPHGLEYSIRNRVVYISRPPCKEKDK